MHGCIHAGTLDTLKHGVLHTHIPDRKERHNKVLHQHARLANIICRREEHFQEENESE
jgi:hypothetical protein